MSRGQGTALLPHKHHDAPWSIILQRCHFKKYYICKSDSWDWRPWDRMESPCVEKYKKVQTGALHVCCLSHWHLICLLWYRACH
jgi:hypothetical protein